MAFDLAVHLGTVLSVLTIYRKSIFDILKDIAQSTKTKSSTPGFKLAYLVIVGSIPTALIGFGFKDQFEKLFSNLTCVGIAFFVTGVLLFLTRGKKMSNMESVNMADFGSLKGLSISKALIIGVAQGLAITPGISRSGSTIATSILLGVDRQTAALFSFMLSIPAIIGACLLQAKDIEVWNAALLAPLGIGLVTAYFAGLLGLWLVLKFVKQGRLEVFSFYLWGLSLYILTKVLF